jgi:hypothetical protein
MTEQNNTEQDAARQQANPYANGNNPFVNQQPQPSGSNPYGDDSSQQPARAQSSNSQAPQPPVGHETPEQGAARQQPDARQQPKPPQQAQGNDPLPPYEGGVIPGVAKAIWFSAGLLLGIIGMLVVYTVNIWRPKSIRREILRYSAIGVLAGAVIDLALLSAMGLGTGTGIMGSLSTTSPFGAAPTTSGGIF